MSVQSSMNQMLATGAVLSKFAAPQMEARAKLKKFRRDYQATIDEMAEELTPIIDQVNNKGASLSDLESLADITDVGDRVFDNLNNQYISQLEGMYESAPGDPKITKALENALHARDLKLGGKAELYPQMARAMEHASNTQSLMRQRRLLLPNVRKEQSLADNESYNRLKDRIEIIQEQRKGLKYRKGIQNPMKGEIFNG